MNNKQRKCLSHYGPYSTQNTTLKFTTVLGHAVTTPDLQDAARAALNECSKPKRISRHARKGTKRERALELLILRFWKDSADNAHATTNLLVKLQRELGVLVDGLPKEPRTGDVV